MSLFKKKIWLIVFKPPALMLHTCSICIVMSDIEQQEDVILTSLILFQHTHTQTISPEC